MRIGASSKNITPASPVELAGYGYFLERTSTGIESNLGATALTFTDDDGARAALCSVDLLSIDEATVKKVGETVRQLSPDRSADLTLLINASHTHSGPATRHLIGAGGYNPDYIDTILVPRLADTILQAFENETDGEIGIARESAEGVSYNRAGGTSLDTRVTVVRAETELETIGGAHFACHPVVYGKGSSVISSDYPGVARATLREIAHTDREFWLTGCCGDIDPLVNKERKGNTNQADVVGMGRIIGHYAADLFDGVRTNRAKILSSMSTVEVPIDTDFELDVKREVEAFREARGLPKSQDLSGIEHWLEAAAPIVNHNTDTTLSVPVTLIKIGKLAFAGFGAEIYNSTGKSIEAAHPDLDIVTVMNSNAHQGYVPTPQDYENGLYAARTSAFIFGRKPLTVDSATTFEQAVNAKIAEL